jgi:hypothetical protein
MVVGIDSSHALGIIRPAVIHGRDATEMLRGMLLRRVMGVGWDSIVLTPIVLVVMTERKGVCHGRH